MFQPHLPVLLLLAATTALASPAQRGPRLFDQSLNSTWRCGVWIPLPDTKYEEPLAKYFVIQNQIPATCPARFKDTYKKGTFAKHCAKMGEKWESLWSPTDTQKNGPKYGDQVCEIMERQLDMPDIPNEEFPDGVMFGYYYNYCENEEWKDTGKRSEKLVCCLGGKYSSCELVFEARAAAEEAEARAAAEAAAKKAAEEAAARKLKEEAEAREALVAKLEGIKDKLRAGAPLTEEEYKEMQTYIAGLKSTAAFLLATAAELEALLEQNTG